jgi:hypothetical protein
MDNNEFKIGDIIKISNPILKKHKKFLNMVGKIISLSDTNIPALDVIPTAFIKFPYNVNGDFEFLIEEIELTDRKNYNEPEPVKKPEFEGHKFHKATQDELKANDVPIIPDGTGSNKIGSVKWELGDNYPWTEYAYADKSEHKFIKDYVLGNVFRPDKDGDPEINIDRERSVYNRIYSLYNKQLDWAWIERKVYNNHRRTCYDKAGNLTFKKEWDITKSASDWKNYLGNTKHILYSKFGKERFYYHFAFCGNKFRIVKVLFPIEQDNDVIFERACMDYAIGNFFISKKDAKRSLMFQKIKTFFKYDEV